MRRAIGAAAAAAALLVAAAGCGDDGDAKQKRFDPFGEVQQPSRAAATGTRDAAPHWEPVAALSGTGAATRPFAVARGAIQWRARWRCQRGGLKLTSLSGDRRGGLTDARCPRSGTSEGSGTGALRMAVEASGPWRVVIEQQVDTPLREPPLAAMSATGAKVISRGRFTDVERTGRGTASLYRLPSGRLALRFDGDFATSSNTDLFVWLSTAARPRTTVHANAAEHVVLRTLKSTLGSQNYVLPAGTVPTSVRSIVIWCNPVRIAYAVAPLRPV